MVRYRVRGGNALRGTVFIQGAKNAVLPMIGASLLAAKGRTVLRNVPLIEDVRRAVELAAGVGAKVELHEAERTLVIDASRLTSPVLPAEIARRFRGSVLFVPALLHRLGEAIIEGVGGCNLGSRNLDFHYLGFKRLGAIVDEGETVIHVKAGRPERRHPLPGHPVAHRHREPDHGRLAGPGHHGDRERGAGARGPRRHRLAHQDGRADQRRRHRLHHRRGRRRAAPRSSTP